MSSCPKGAVCVFAQTVEPSVVKRIKYSSAYPYCRGGRHEECAIHSEMSEGKTVTVNLLPDGSIGDYRDDVSWAPRTSGGIRRFLVVDDSPVFATIAANAVRLRFPDADVVQCHSFVEAEPMLRHSGFTLVVSGHGLGNGHTVHDVRRLTSAPIVLFTGRAPGPGETPQDAAVVTKDAGPGALKSAIESALGF